MELQVLKTPIAGKNPSTDGAVVAIHQVLTVRQVPAVIKIRIQLSGIIFSGLGKTEVVIDLLRAGANINLQNNCSKCVVYYLW